MPGFCVNLLAVTGTNPLALHCQRLAQKHFASGIWVGLPEEIIHRVEIPGASPLDEIAAWITSRQPAPDFKKPCIGKGLAVPADQFIEAGLSEESLPTPEIDGWYWAALPLFIEDYPPGVILLSRNRPFEESELGQETGLVVDACCLVVEHILFKQTSSQYRFSLETLHTVSLRMASTLDLQEVLYLLVESTLDLLSLDAAQIYIHQPSVNEISPFSFGAAIGNVAPGRPAASNPAPEELLIQVGQHNWPLIIDQLEGQFISSTNQASSDSEETLSYSLQAAGWQIASLAGYPLMRGGRLLGVFIISYLKPHRFTPSERYLLSLLTDEAVAVIDNARVAHSLNARLAQVTALHTLAQKLGATLDMESVLDNTAQGIRDLFNASAVSIMLLQPDQTLRLAAASGLAQNLPDPVLLDTGKGLAGKVAQQGTAVYIPDLRAQDQVVLTDSNLRSLLVSPLVAQGEVIGSLSVDSYRPYAFGPDSARLVDIAAAQAAVAIQNARMFQDEQTRSEEMAALIELGRLITQQMDVEHIFNAARQAVQRLMPAEVFVISLLDWKTQETVVTYLVERDVRYPPMRQSGGNSLSEYVIHNVQPLLYEDLLRQSTPFQGVHFGEQTPVRSLVAVPLCSGGNTTGMISAQSYQPEAYQQHDLQLLQSVSNHVGIAVENSHLYTDLSDRLQALQEANRMRLEFAQNTAKQLRLPLTYIQAYVELLLEGDLGELNDRQREIILLLQSKTATLAGLAEDLTTLEKNGRDWLSMAEVDLRHLIRNSLFQAERAAAKKEVTMSYEMPPTFPKIQADPDRLAQVIEILLTNAIQYAKPSSEIVVVLETVSAKPGSGLEILEQAKLEMDKPCESSSCLAVVSIFDQGDAIPKKEQDTLFDRYYQIDLQNPGKGLGLAVTRHIVEAHGGRVWIESAPGIGNAFYIALPYNSGGE